MNCERIQVYLERWVDGEVSGRLRRRIEVHLQDCPICRQQAQVYHALADALEQARAEFDVESPAEFTQAVLARARTLRRDQSGRPAYLRWALAGGLAAGLAILALVYLGESRGPAVPPPRVAQGGLVPDPDQSIPAPSPIGVIPVLPGRSGEARKWENQETGKRGTGQSTQRRWHDLQPVVSSPVGGAEPTPQDHETRGPKRAHKPTSPGTRSGPRGPRRMVQQRSQRTKTSPAVLPAPHDTAPVAPEPSTKDERPLPSLPDFWIATTRGADSGLGMADVELVRQREMLQIEAEVAEQQEEIDRRQRQTDLCWRAAWQREELYPSYAYNSPVSGPGRCDQLLADLGHASSL
jgi:hypothetical protein